MSKISDKQYKKIAKAFAKKGYTPKSAFEALESNGFCVTLKGETFEKVYASRVMALMYNNKSEGKSLSLD